MRGLQRDLESACAENRSLVKEMEALNHMFAEMERTTQAAQPVQQQPVEEDQNEGAQEEVEKISS